MARLPYNTGAAYSLNILKLLAHSSGTYEKWATLAGAHFTFRELTILLTTAKLKSTYEFTHHTPVSKAAGVTDEQRGLLQTAGESKGYFAHTSSELFDEKETALLQFVEALIETETGDVEDVVFDRVKEMFGDRQVVEVVSLQGFYYTFSRLTTVLRDMDEAPKV